jgi:hypothetical protein
MQFRNLSLFAAFAIGLAARIDFPIQTRAPVRLNG